MRKFLVLLTLALAGCQTTATTTVTNTAATVYTTVPAELAAAGSGVKQVDAIPPNAQKMGRLSALACQKLTSDPVPTRDYALALLKKEAAARGATLIGNVTIAEGSTNLTANCWANVEASADAAIL